MPLDGLPIMITGIIRFMIFVEGMLGDFEANGEDVSLSASYDLLLCFQVKWIYVL